MNESVEVVLDVFNITRRNGYSDDYIKLLILSNSIKKYDLSSEKVGLIFSTPKNEYEKNNISSLDLFKLACASKEVLDDIIYKR